MRLNNFLQSKLRENTSISYTRTVSPEKPEHHGCNLRVGPTRLYQGISSVSYEAAMACAADEAYKHLSILETEDNIRWFLGLPHRFHLPEFDAVRDQLRALKQRIKREPVNRSMAYREIGFLYTKVDSVERELLNLGLSE